FEFNDEYISSNVNPLFNEVLEDIKSKASYDESALLVTSLSDANENECFDSKGDVDEINAFDIPSDFEDGYYDSKGDVLYLENLLSDDTTPNLPPEVFLDRDPRSLSDINDLKIMVKVFDLEIPKKIFSPTYVSLPFKDRHDLSLAYVIRIFFLILPIRDDTTPNLPPEVFLDRDPRSLSDINDLKIMVKVFELEIPKKIFSPTYILPFFSPPGVRILLLTPTSPLFIFLL
nr:hypothetical protein [Tanacetum cinerariifolium]